MEDRRRLEIRCGDLYNTVLFRKAGLSGSFRVDGVKRFLEHLNSFQWAKESLYDVRKRLGEIEEDYDQRLEEDLQKQKEDLQKKLNAEAPEWISQEDYRCKILCAIAYVDAQLGNINVNDTYGKMLNETYRESVMGDGDLLIIPRKLRANREYVLNNLVNQKGLNLQILMSVPEFGNDSEIVSMVVFNHDPNICNYWTFYKGEDDQSLDGSKFNFRYRMCISPKIFTNPLFWDLLNSRIRMYNTATGSNLELFNKDLELKAAINYVMENGLECCDGLYSAEERGKELLKKGNGETSF